MPPTSPPDSFDVAIVGNGPTGAALANLVSQTGLSVVVIEREPEMYHLPRAVHFDGETMRVFQTIGIADELAKKIRVNPGMRFVGIDGELLLDWPRPQDLGPQGWYASYRLHQPDLEKLLREKLTASDQVTVLSNHVVFALKDTGPEVLLSYKNRSNGQIQGLRAKFVVGCDGASSLVREAIGAGLNDFGFQERWLVVDLLLKQDRPDLGDHSVQFCNPTRPMTYCRSPGIRRRWEITVLDDETDDEITRPEKIWELLSPWIDPNDADLERSAVYTFRSAIADKWREGRVLIAGDAAHLTPPFMGQGMCAGIRDASNLGWKLALCVNGHELELLDTYQEERGPHASAFINMAMQLGRLVNALDCDKALEMASDGETGEARLKTIAPPLGCSALVNENDQISGTLCDQPFLKDNIRLDDLVGYAPVLITRLANFPIDMFIRCLNASDDPSLLLILDHLDTDAVLLRPDRYIIGTAKTESYVETLLSRLQSSLGHNQEKNGNTV